jgi:hypothetical protein
MNQGNTILVLWDLRWYQPWIRWTCERLQVTKYNFLVWEWLDYVQQLVAFELVKGNNWFFESHFSWDLYPVIGCSRCELWHSANPCVIGNSADELWVLTSIHPHNEVLPHRPKNRQCTNFIPVPTQNICLPHTNQKWVMDPIQGLDWFESF